MREGSAGSSIGTCGTDSVMTTPLSYFQTEKASVAEKCLEVEKTGQSIDACPLALHEDATDGEGRSFRHCEMHRPPSGPLTRPKIHRETHEATNDLPKYFAHLQHVILLFFACQTLEHIILLLLLPNTRPPNLLLLLLLLPLTNIIRHCDTKALQRDGRGDQLPPTTFQENQISYKERKS